MRNDASNPLRQIVLTAAFAITAICCAPLQSDAAPLAPVSINAGHLADQSADAPILQVRARAVARHTAVGPRGGVYQSRTVVRRGPVARPGYHGGGVRWARPANYRWPRGGAIAAGAAIGMVTAATAAAWAGAAPAPGMCWYYTDPSRTQGFWDYCR
ncbi:MULTISPECIES: hypothetical protein [unclassified Bradyrhizobium]|uniref:hypothetical protein n=1 Tax=unclassified Bradyrhizobium TaxID=2631580 RepID=UPI001FF8200A|nr:MULTISPECIES: hypothetical protein [unclassified Bradyrhizobium]